MKKLVIVLGICVSIILPNFNGTAWAYEMNPLTDPVFGFQQTSQYGTIILMFWNRADSVYFDLILTDILKEQWKDRLIFDDIALSDLELTASFLQEYDNIVDTADLLAFLDDNNFFTPENGWDDDNLLGESETSTVPEPSTYLLMGAGLLMLIGVARKQKMQPQKHIHRNNT